MNEIQLKLNNQGRGAFVMEEDGAQIAQMQVAIEGGNLIVYHTEVALSHRGKGISEKLLSAMVEYARQHTLKVIALCPYVLARFKKNPERYDDVWNRHWKEK